MTSRKFISAEGGLRRMVWMPKELKHYLRENLEQRAEALGLEDFISKIADETICTDSAGLMEFLTKVNHPAVSMPALM